MPVTVPVAPPVGVPEDSKSGSSMLLMPLPPLSQSELKSVGGDEHKHHKDKKKKKKKNKHKHKHKHKHEKHDREKEEKEKSVGKEKKEPERRPDHFYSSESSNMNSPAVGTDPGSPEFEVI